MNRRTLSLALAIAVLTFAQASTSQARGGFSARSLRGVYGFSGSGTLAGGTMPAAVVGLNSFDGVRNCSITARLNAGGVVHSISSTSCTYFVNPDGTGWSEITITGTPFPLPEFRSDFVIVDNGDETHFVLSDAAGGTVANGVAKRQITHAR